MDFLAEVGRENAAAAQGQASVAAIDAACQGRKVRREEAGDPPK
ncbi:Hypothetical protein RAK1035_2560 [Roseovarius sp. AK1035]|nr:Hypothetical protein RAK1035_2560 [Roseovarius sp. AK1035]